MCLLLLYRREGGFAEVDVEGRHCGVHALEFARGLQRAVGVDCEDEVGCGVAHQAVAFQHELAIAQFVGHALVAKLACRHAHEEVGVAGFQVAVGIAVDGERGVYRGIVARAVVVARAEIVFARIFGCQLVARHGGNEIIGCEVYLHEGGGHVRAVVSARALHAAVGRYVEYEVGSRGAVVAIAHGHAFERQHVVLVCVRHAGGDDIRTHCRDFQRGVAFLGVARSILVDEQLACGFNGVVVVGGRELGGVVVFERHDDDNGCLERVVLRDAHVAARIGGGVNLRVVAGEPHLLQIVAQLEHEVCAVRTALAVALQHVGDGERLGGGIVDILLAVAHGGDVVVAAIYVHGDGSVARLGCAHEVLVEDDAGGVAERGALFEVAAFEVVVRVRGCAVPVGRDYFGVRAACDVDGVDVRTVFKRHGYHSAFDGVGIFFALDGSRSEAVELDVIACGVGGEERAGFLALGDKLRVAAVGKYIFILYGTVVGNEGFAGFADGRSALEVNGGAVGVDAVVGEEEPVLCARVLVGGFHQRHVGGGVALRANVVAGVLADEIVARVLVLVVVVVVNVAEDEVVGEERAVHAVCRLVAEGEVGVFALGQFFHIVLETACAVLIRVEVYETVFHCVRRAYVAGTVGFEFEREGRGIGLGEQAVARGYAETGVFAHEWIALVGGQLFGDDADSDGFVGHVEGERVLAEMVVFGGFPEHEAGVVGIGLARVLSHHLVSAFIARLVADYEVHLAVGALRRPVHGLFVADGIVVVDAVEHHEGRVLVELAGDFLISLADRLVLQNHKLRKGQGSGVAHEGHHDGHRVARVARVGFLVNDAVDVVNHKRNEGAVGALGVQAFAHLCLQACGAEHEEREKGQEKFARFHYFRLIR